MFTFVADGNFLIILLSFSSKALLVSEGIWLLRVAVFVTNAKVLVTYILGAITSGKILMVGLAIKLEEAIIFLRLSRELRRTPLPFD